MKAPIRVEDGVFLVDADSELICRTESATPEELEHLVNSVNVHGEIVSYMQSMGWYTADDGQIVSPSGLRKGLAFPNWPEAIKACITLFGVEPCHDQLYVGLANETNGDEVYVSSRPFPDDGGDLDAWETNRFIVQCPSRIEPSIWLGVVRNVLVAGGATVAMESS